MQLSKYLTVPKFTKQNVIMMIIAAFFIYMIVTTLQQQDQNKEQYCGSCESCKK